MLLPLKLAKNINPNNSFLTKKNIFHASLSISLFLSIVTLSLDSTFAQPGTNKNAIIFWAVRVIDSHDWWGCADWNVYAQVNYATVILDYCVDEDNTYGIIPSVALVVEYPSNEKPLLYIHGTDEDFWAGEFLRITALQISNPPFSPFPFYLPSATIDGIPFDEPDYYTGFSMIDCHSSAGQYQPICNLPPGPYYKWADQDYWIWGIPPDPDLEGCWWIFC